MYPVSVKGVLAAPPACGRVQQRLEGYSLEGEIDSELGDPEEIAMMAFTRKKAWWKLW
jgi:hypothetical protein